MGKDSHGDEKMDQQQKNARVMKVISIGNSFSVNAHTYLRQLSQAAECPLTLFNCVIGGCTFEGHMKRVDAFEANPGDPEGKPYGTPEGGTISLRDALHADKWEIVTIQQASHESFKPESYHPHADRLISYVRKHASQAEIVVHETWAYREDHGFWGNPEINTDVMCNGLGKAYRAFCKENNFRMIPCGDAFQNARLSKEWGKPDFSKKEIEGTVSRTLHDEWGFHANDNGCFLLSCVWFEFLFGKDVRGVPFKPDGVSEADAAILRGIAHKTIQSSDRSP